MWTFETNSVNDLKHLEFHVLFALADANEFVQEKKYKIQSYWFPTLYFSGTRPRFLGFSQLVIRILK